MADKTARSRWRVIVRSSEDIAPDQESFTGDQVFSLPIDVPEPNALQHSTWIRMGELGLKPTDAAVDLYRAAAAAFAADLRVPRARAYDRWSRDISLSIPVSDAQCWKKARGPFQRLLCFLTGDHWEVDFYEADVVIPSTSPHSQHAAPFQPNAVCLLSGGLDSFIGASDLLDQGNKLLFISHYATGSAASSSPAQQAVISALTERYPGKFKQLWVHVSARSKGFTGSTEDTTRSRSIIFLALGTLAASALEQNARHLVVPENGFISLNPPLTLTRLGSLSTRTTHPHTLALFKEVLGALGLDVEISAPYRLKTKGEMLRDATDKTFVRKHALATVSCARPTISRFHPQNPHKHCGYCVPCIIRRAAFTKFSPDQTGYFFDPRNFAAATPAQRKDARAFLLALQRNSNRTSVADLLATGPLTGVGEPVSHYMNVYRRGLAEVQDFFRHGQ